VKNVKVLHSQGGNEYSTYNEQKEGYLDWSHLALELPSTARYWRKDRKDGKDDKEDKRGHWMTLSKWEDTGPWKRKH
jgi:hypothetical protein